MQPRRIPARGVLPAIVVALLVTSAGCTRGGPESTGPDATRTSETTHAPKRDGAPVVIMGAGDVAGDEQDAGATARLIEAEDPDAVFTTGDNAYPDGSASDYRTKYDPTWGAFKDRTHPVPGNHDYNTEDAQAYVDYFGADNVTNSVDGGLYYAWDVGNGWRAYALNSEISTTGAQLDWLRDDVAAHPDQHYILYAHRPRYTSGENHGPSEDICPLWDELAATGGLEIVLTGHNHHYERFEPMDCAGKESADGARSFVVGSGGKDLYDFGDARRGSEFRNNRDFGLLKLVLYENSYEWEFVAAGRGEDDADTVAAENVGQVLDKGSEDV